MFVNRLKLLCTVLMGVATLAACGNTAVKPKVADRSARTQPNIIYILADDLGYGDLGVYGQTKVKTPNLDKLAAKGMRFTQHYSGSAVCAPSRSTLLTGQHTGNTQIRGNAGQSKNTSYLAAGTLTVGTILQDAGYVTATIGKWGLGTYDNPGAPDKQGMDYFYGYIDQVLAHNYYPEFLWENGEKQMLENGGIGLHPNHVEYTGQNLDTYYRKFIGKDYAPDLMQEKAKSFISENAERPFFLYYATTIPHAALQISEKEMGVYNFEEIPADDGYYPVHPRPRAARAAMITYLDQQVGEIVAMLEKLGIAENTLIVFTSDNGPSDEGKVTTNFFNANGGLRGGKRDLTDGGVRVPMIAYWSGTIEAGSASEHVSAMWDLLPTAAELAGQPYSSNIDGISYLPTLLGQPDQKQHEHLYWEFHAKAGGGPAQAVRLGDWKGLRLMKGLKVEQYSDVPISLYNLADDPGETTDVVSDHPEVAKKITEVMAARTQSSNERWNFPQKD